METKEILVGDVQETMVETKTNSQEYEVTDHQISNTDSPQFAFLSGTSSVALL